VTLFAGLDLDHNKYRKQLCFFNFSRDLRRRVPQSTSNGSREEKRLATMPHVHIPGFCLDDNRNTLMWFSFHNHSARMVSTMERVRV